jgi:hypothetical protein
MFAVICKPEHIFVRLIMVYLLRTVIVKNESFSWSQEILQERKHYYYVRKISTTTVPQPEVNEYTPRCNTSFRRTRLPLVPILS